MSAHALACRVAATVIAANGRPLFVLLFPLLCGAIILAGWACGHVSLTLLALTTALSIDASWVNRLQLLARAQDKGAVE